MATGTNLIGMVVNTISKTQDSVTYRVNIVTSNLSSVVRQVNATAYVNEYSAGDIVILGETENSYVIMEASDPMKLGQIVGVTNQGLDTEAFTVAVWWFGCSQIVSVGVDGKYTLQELDPDFTVTAWSGIQGLDSTTLTVSSVVKVVQVRGVWYVVEFGNVPNATILTDFFVDMFDRKDATPMTGPWSGATESFSIKGKALIDIPQTSGVLTSAAGLRTSEYFGSMSFGDPTQPDADKDGYIKPGTSDVYSFTFGRSGVLSLTVQCYTALSQGSLSSAQSAINNGITGLKPLVYGYIDGAYNLMQSYAAYCKGAKDYETIYDAGMMLYTASSSANLKQSNYPSSATQAFITSANNTQFATKQSSTLQQDCVTLLQGVVASLTLPTIMSRAEPALDLVYRTAITQVNLALQHLQKFATLVTSKDSLDEAQSEFLAAVPLLQTAFKYVSGESIIPGVVTSSTGSTTPVMGALGYYQGGAFMPVFGTTQGVDAQVGIVAAMLAAMSELAKGLWDVAFTPGPFATATPSLNLKDVLLGEVDWVLQILSEIETSIFGMDLGFQLMGSAYDGFQSGLQHFHQTVQKAITDYSSSLVKQVANLPQSKYLSATFSGTGVQAVSARDKPITTCETKFLCTSVEPAHVSVWLGDYELVFTSDIVKRKCNKITITSLANNSQLKSVKLWGKNVNDSLSDLILSSVLLETGFGRYSAQTGKLTYMDSYHKPVVDSSGRITSYTYLPEI